MEADRRHGREARRARARGGCRREGPAAVRARARGRPRRRRARASRLVPAQAAEDAITSVAYSPDGARLAIAGSKGTVALVDTAGDQVVCETKPLKGRSCAWPSADGAQARRGQQLRPHHSPSWPIPNCHARAHAPWAIAPFVMDLGFTGDDDYPRVGEPRQHDADLGSSSERRSTRGASGAPGRSPGRAGRPTTSTAWRCRRRAPPRDAGQPRACRHGRPGHAESDSAGETLTLWDIGATRLSTRAAVTAPADALEGLDVRMALARSLLVGAQDPERPASRLSLTSRPPDGVSRAGLLAVPLV